MDDAGFADKASADRQLANAVAKHKSMFFAEKAADRSPIDYAAAVNGNLVLTPSGEGLRALGEDYARMVDDGLLLGDSEPFEHLIERCAQIQAHANKSDASKSAIAGPQPHLPISVIALSPTRFGFAPIIRRLLVAGLGQPGHTVGGNRGMVLYKEAVRGKELKLNR